MEVWGGFARLLALIYIIAFWSLWREVLPLYGSRGVTPARPKLDRAGRDYGRVRAVLRHPSLLWLSSSDRMLRALPIAGAAAALLAGLGIASPVTFAIAWVIYLSLDVAIGMTFPWESLLFEAGFLAIFLPPLDAAPQLTMSALPPPLLMAAYHWLLFRVMFGFGKTKFTRDAARDPLYLRAFLISQPIPSPLGWRACRLPAPLLKAGLGSLFIIEMVLPFLTFFPGWPRWIAAAGFTGLMVSIQLMGNFGHFNLLVIALSVSLFDPRSLADASWRELLHPAGLAAAWSLVLGLVQLPFNTWVARGWPEWPAWAAAPRPLRGIAAFFRVVMPFRTSHAYGVFPPQIGPPLKLLPIVEGSMDGTDWETFEYRYMPSVPTSPPKFVAPFCPRLDHFAIYEAAGVGHANLLGTVFSVGVPHELAFAGPADRWLQQLMDPASPVRELFARVPFNGTPPRFMRMQLYTFMPTSLAEQRATGRYWRRDCVGVHVPARPCDPAVLQHWVPAAEQLHPDERWARRRIPRLAGLRAARGTEAVRLWLDDRARAQWDRFWTELVPAARESSARGWEAVDALGASIEERFDVATRADLDRVRGAVATALLERLDPHVLGLAAPAVKVRSYFHASLVSHAFILEGADAVDQALRDPAGLIAFASGSHDTPGLMVMTVFRRQLMRMHARKHRLIAAVLPPTDHPDGVPGFALTMPFLAAGLPEPGEVLPRLQQLADGTWLQDDRLIIG